MGKYTTDLSNRGTWQEGLLTVLTSIANELAEANRLKRIELQMDDDHFDLRKEEQADEDQA